MPLARRTPWGGGRDVVRVTPSRLRLDGSGGEWRPDPANTSGGQRGWTDGWRAGGGGPPVAQVRRRGGGESRRSLVCTVGVLSLAVVPAALQKLHKCVTQNTTELLQGGRARR